MSNANFVGKIYPTAVPLIATRRLSLEIFIKSINGSAPQTV